MCGGTRIYGTPIIVSEGLSPRVRGNPLQAVDLRPHRGSIPACAGEPIANPALLFHRQVYPRVCGGTMSAVRAMADDNGLSPRVRGNPCCWKAVSRITRSIPACAGEPPYVHDRRDGAEVYPRVCGGTPCYGRWYRVNHGLSPRVRGNPAPASRRAPFARSIPACAGEPHLSTSPRACSSVYPRVCGGTDAAIAVLCQSIGLSPRVRGNQGYSSLP